jgi:hypothetical protein
LAHWVKTIDWRWWLAVGAGSTGSNVGTVNTVSALALVCSTGGTVAGSIVSAQWHYWLFCLGMRVMGGCLDRWTILIK